MVEQSFTWSTFEIKPWSNNSAPGPSVQRRAPKPTDALSDWLAAGRRAPRGAGGRGLASQISQSASALPGFLYDTHWSCRLKVILSFQTLTFGFVCRKRVSVPWHYIKRFLTRDKQNNKADELDGQQYWDSSSPDRLTHVDMFCLSLIVVFVLFRSANEMRHEWIIFVSFTNCNM